MTTSFEQLGVDPALVKALSERGIDRAFPIQQLTITDALADGSLRNRRRAGASSMRA